MARLLTLAALLLLAVWPPPIQGSDADVLRPRVPSELLEEVRRWSNPVQATPENLEKGKTLFHGKAFCATCHGRDGRGLSDIAGLRGKLPRNFTDQAWQAARADGELFWKITKGITGIMPSMEKRLTEEERWHVVNYIRTLAKEPAKP